MVAAFLVDLDLGDERADDLAPLVPGQGVQAIAYACSEVVEARDDLAQLHRPAELVFGVVQLALRAAGALEARRCAP